MNQVTSTPNKGPQAGQNQPKGREVPSAKPGTKEPKAKKEKKVKVKRVEYPGLFTMKDDEKVRVRLNDWPKDFDPKAHKPLRRGDFENEAFYLTKRADEFEARAKQYRAEAVTIAKLGNTADRAKAKRLATLTTRVAELKAQLAGQGVDVEAMLKAMLADVEAKPEGEAKAAA